MLRLRGALVFPFTHVGGLGWFCAGLMAGCAHVAVKHGLRRRFAGS